MTCPSRTYPLRQPKNHKPPIPRWQLVLPEDVDHLFTAYVGVQPHSDVSEGSEAVKEAIASIQAWLDSDSDRPLANECFNHLDGDDAPNTTLWVCYWIDEAKGKRSLQRLGIRSVYSRLSPSQQSSLGLWTESFVTPISRLETNYSGLDYLPGLAKLPDTNTAEHKLSAYWGAARDRIPDSAHDLFEQDDAAQKSRPNTVPKGLGQYLTGTNYDNMVHIRSGQFWENCGPEETDSYENNLEPTLRGGLAYLWNNREEGGAIGLRYLGNRDDTGQTKKETCGAGFFTSLHTLEEWAKRHRSHLAIYLGAIKHAKTFGEERKFRTWHEVSVLKRGEASFEYVNCLPTTGVIQFVSLELVSKLG
ncbi:phenylacetaldoxime dehydratase [Colletotrichum truncatum]|uniref:Phenylacetaldoxime dehydratase n=1 Tax=Colletotrichum truncatum TaxID=5467 RepID=A0ACC3YP03_COLTU|nr:phenylacetaldoxime dehydratase [Colletotrichum truncatum]KAF6782800.1 phenylacetaldoxime dehydratase [Colletotrichum truncatum]